MPQVLAFTVNMNELVHSDISPIDFPCLFTVVVDARPVQVSPACIMHLWCSLYFSPSEILYICCRQDYLICNIFEYGQAYWT